MTDIRIETDADICKFTLHGIPDRPGMAAEIFGRLGMAGISVHMMAATGAEAGHTDISLTVVSREKQKVAESLEALRRELESGPLTQREDVVAVSVLADDLDQQPGVAGRMFRTLSAEGINIDMISATNTAVTCLVDARYLEAAKTALTKDFQTESAE